MRTIDSILSDPMLTKEQADFAKLVLNHDLTYDFSDDGRVYRAGEACYQKIKSESTKFDRGFVVEVWNACVDRKIVERSRSSFYWKA